MGLAWLLIAMLAQDEQQAMERRPSGPHRATQSKTWSLGVTLEPCGDVIIDRIDEYQLGGPPDQIVTSSPNQRKVIQWTVHGVSDRQLTLGQVLVEMSLRRVVFRVFYRAAGVGDVRFLYFSPAGASTEKMPPLPPEGAHDPETMFRWRSLHDWTPSSPFNPNRSAFDHLFPTLVHQVDARAEMVIRFVGQGCPVPPV